MNALVAVLIFVAGSVVTAIVRLYFAETLEHLASTTVGRFVQKGQPDLRGRWTSSYTYPHDGEVFQTKQIMQFVQTGKNVRGKNVGGSSPHRHKVRLQIEGQYLTGTWRNTVQGATHFGALQLKLNPNGTSMAGRWVGFDSQGVVQGGNWEWTRSS